MNKEEKISEFVQFSNGIKIVPFNTPIGKVVVNGIEITSVEDWEKVTKSLVDLQQENKALKETLKQLYRIHSTSNMSEEEWLDYAIKYNSGQLGGKE